MFQEQTQFTVLPNEVVYDIFEFLTTLDILRAFSQLNHRYANLVRFYIKRVDLTDGWQGDQRKFQWISERIQTLKIDRFHLHLLTDFQYPQLRSLDLVNVFNWDKVISNLNLINLSFWFDGSLCYYDAEKRIPHTVIKLSTNTMLAANAFHMNLIDLNVRIDSVVHLLEIVEQIPNVQHLSVTFANIFRNYHSVENHQSHHFETLIMNFHGLNSLTRLSFSTNDGNGTESNELLPFHQIEGFIDRCYPNKTIIRSNVVALKLDRIRFHKDIWSTIVRYRNIFDRFDFYVSFIVEENTSIDIERLLTNNDFDFHFEGRDLSCPQDHFIHIYSLPFAFDKLYGFNSCSKLNSRTSFSMVRHLYFTPPHLDPMISFESLTKHVSNLISIYCNNLCICNDNKINSQIFADRDIFSHVRFLYFVSQCRHEDRPCQNLLIRLLDRMPRLRCLSTNIATLLHEHNEKRLNTQLDTKQCSFELFDILAKCVPYLSTIWLDDILSCRAQFSEIVSSLFIRFSSLRLVYFKFCRPFSQDGTPSRKIAHNALVYTQNIENRLHHLKLDYESERVLFYLEN